MSRPTSPYRLFTSEHRPSLLVLWHLTFSLLLTHHSKPSCSVDQNNLYYRPMVTFVFLEYLWLLLIFLEYLWLLRKRYPHNTPVHINGHIYYLWLLFTLAISNDWTYIKNPSPQFYNLTTWLTYWPDFLHPSTNLAA